MPRTHEEDEESTHKVERSRDRDAPDATPQTEKKTDESQLNQDCENHMARTPAAKGRKNTMRSTSGKKHWEEVVTAEEADVYILTETKLTRMVYRLSSTGSSTTRTTPYERSRMGEDQK